MEKGLDLAVDGVLPSRPYVLLTEDVLRRFGVSVHSDSEPPSWRVAAGPALPAELSIEPDWSAAAFFVAAVAVAGGSITLDALSTSSLQGDRVVSDVVSGAGVKITDFAGGLAIDGVAERPIAADLRDTPDLFPALAVVAAAAPSGSRFTGLENLKHKESDRLQVMISNLEGLGAAFEHSPSSLTVTRGISPATGFARSVESADDHRIAMAMAVASLVSGPLELDDPDCVQKSFPGFWQTWTEVVGDDADD
jgi:3-phosphoshikimate 1-carboxyvinyltransferase